jgi:hypothetical protein
MDTCCVGDDGSALAVCGWKQGDVQEALKPELRDIRAGLDDMRTLVVTHFHCNT